MGQFGWTNPDFIICSFWSGEYLDSTVHYLARTIEWDNEELILPT